MKPDFSRTISFDRLVSWHINWATVEFNTAMEYSVATLDVCTAKLKQVSRIYNELVHTFTLLGYAYGDDDFCVHVGKRDDMREFRANVVRATENLSERVARFQLDELNKMNATTRLAGHMVARFDPEAQRNWQEWEK